MKKTAVILFNLGGPDKQESVRPFLFNLFNDPAIIRAPAFARLLIAKLISSRRAPVARAIYARMGGGSPILSHTKEQAEALDKILNAPTGGALYKSFIAMRYWHPRAAQTAQEVKEFAPDEIILLPLYPQFSTTTTESSFKEWAHEAKKSGIAHIPTKKICCYPQQSGFIRALAEKTKEAYKNARAFGAPRILFSAHGLPEKIVKAGDPYATQCSLTVDALRRKIDIPDADIVLCFQSRVGSLKWIGPATDAEVRRAGADKVPLVIAPIAFVSDHSETLVEIDIEYRHLAKETGVPHFAFVPAVGTAPDFIDGLASLVKAAQAQTEKTAAKNGARSCPTQSQCPCGKE